MKYNIKKIGICLIAVLTIFLITNCTFAHSGRTDSSGGHKDNQNKSGLGGYHYHCGGNPAHLHTNGVCPYSASSSTSNSSSVNFSNSDNNNSANSSNSNNNTLNNNNANDSDSNNSSTDTVPITGIKINKDIKNMKVGDTEHITATIKPLNATNKKVTWKSSDESVATVSSTGEINAKKAGTVDIIARAVNGQTSILTIKVEEESNSLVGIITLGGIGGGCYLGYSKFKKRK